MLTVGVVGLGLIGGSFAKAYAQNGDRVLAFDIDRQVLEFAKLAGAVCEELTDQNLASCDLVLVAVYPKAAIRYIRDYADRFSKTGVVMDCCGTKREVCEACFPIARQHGFTYVGAHPMAGTQYSGFKHARATLFQGAPMVLVPPEGDDIQLLSRIKQLLQPAGFARLSVTDAEQHDSMIAFTSQLAHIVSNAYIKSPTARAHKGFSAGSYKDMTRVAWLNPDMWAELCMDNRDNLLAELDGLVGQLKQYRDALAGDDFDRLRELLEEGKRLKEEVDGR